MNLTSLFWFGLLLLAKNGFPPLVVLIFRHFDRPWTATLGHFFDTFSSFVSWELRDQRGGTRNEDSERLLGVAHLAFD